MEETSSFDKILGWGLFLGVIFLVWQSYKKQQETQKAEQQNLQESDTNVISYKALLAQWQPLEYEEGNINDLRKKLKVAVKAAGGDVKIETVAPTAVPSVSTIPTVSVEPPTYNYGNHERWKVVRGLDRRIIGYELQRDANIKQS